MPNKTRHHFLAVLLLSGLVQLIGFSAWAQNKAPFLQHTVELLGKQAAVLPIERAYLQLDKPYYVAGDTIWFKGYVTIGVLHRLSAKSGLLNVQLVNENNEVKRTVKLQVNNGVCKGSIALPDSIAEGAYQIRAYTNWMRNFGNDYFFSKPVSIGNAITSTMLSRATFSYTGSGMGRTVSARIHYFDIYGVPYAGRAVKYSISKNGKTVQNGDGVTDNAGYLNIAYQSPEAALPASESIHTSMMFGKKSVDKDIKIRPDAEQLSVQFLPESGYLVNGLPSVVAFKALGKDGLGKNISGVIIDQNNHEVATLSTQHLGMGSFKLTPEAGNSYRAKINTKTGGIAMIDLPVARSSGYTMHVNNEDSAQVVLSIANKLNTTDEVTNLNLVAQSSGVVCYATGISMKTNGIVSVRIPKNRFPSGVAQFTLFSAAGEPLNERIAFIKRNSDMLNLAISTAKTSYQPREKVTINMLATDVSGKAATGAFSAAVINETATGSPQSTDASILSSLLMGYNLKGYIESPGYYFAQNDNKTQDADLDLLMLTQGYRSVRWVDLLKDSVTTPTFTPEYSLAITGMLKTPGGKPVPKGTIRLMTTTGPPLVIDTLSDDQGRFAFHNVEFADSTRFVLQANNVKNKSNVTILVDNKDADTFKLLNSNVAAGTDSIPLTYLQNSKKQYRRDIAYNADGSSVMLRQIDINDTKLSHPETPEMRSSSLNGPGHATQVIDGEVFIQSGCVSLAQCLVGKLMGVVLDSAGQPYSIRNRNSIQYDHAMLIVIDGNMAGGSLDQVNPADVASVELLLDPADLGIYGMKGGNGVIIVNTRKGDERPPQFFSATNVLSNFMPKGYQVYRDFYSPVYNVSNNVVRPDLRTTVSWKPDLYTDENGKLSFSYFNADGKGTYRIIVEGIDNDGNIGRQILRYEVK